MFHNWAFDDVTRFEYLKSRHNENKCEQIKHNCNLETRQKKT